MPRYSYYCESCEAISDLFHPMDEEIDSCPLCLYKGVQKMVSKPVINSAEIVDPSSVKERVDQHIDEARQELNQQVNNMKNEDLLNK